MAQTTIALTAAGGNTYVWYAPVDCSGLVTLNLIGPGAGGGGAYATNTILVSPGKKFFVNFLNNTWINTTNAMPTDSTSTTGAKAAGANTSSTLGGQASACVPTLGAFSGGSGDIYNGTGGGGAAGPNGPGGNGQSWPGSGGTANGNRVAGGGSGSPDETGSPGAQGTRDNIWTDFVGNQYGPASGGGPGSYNPDPEASPFGDTGARISFGGGGSGSGVNYNNGVIIIQYDSKQIAVEDYTEIFTIVGTTPWRVPAGVTKIKAEAIGGGGSGGSSTANDNGGGGGGAYAQTTEINVVPKSIAYISVSASQQLSGGSSRRNNSASWFNTSNSIPTSTSLPLTAVKAAGGYSGHSMQSINSIKTSAGLASESIGDIKIDGGSGEVTYSNAYPRGAGGGGAAGPGGAGKRGGKDRYTLTAAGGGGGGGGAGSGSSTAGGSAVTTTGGTGGQGPSGFSGGSGGTTTTVATASSNGSGGGGGGSSTTLVRANATAGSMYPYSQWTNTARDVFGPGSGGGGAGSANASLGGSAGAGGIYGGGGGAVGGTANASSNGAGGQGIVVLTYTVAAPTANKFFSMF